MPAEPLALPGRERELAAEVSRRLTQADPPAGSLAFGPMALASPWAGALRETWPGRPRPVVRRLRTQGAPAIELREPQLRRLASDAERETAPRPGRSQRAFEAAGGVFRWSDATTLRADAEAFARLHAGRWEGRGWSRLADLGARLPDWLEELGRPLIDAGPLRPRRAGDRRRGDLRRSPSQSGTSRRGHQRRLGPAPREARAGEAVAAAGRRRRLREGLRAASGSGRAPPRTSFASPTPTSPRRGRWSSRPGRALPLAYAQLTPALARRCVRERLERMPEPWAERVKAAAGRLR